MRSIAVGPSPWFADGRGCRGRNGWFKPHTITVDVNCAEKREGNMLISVLSRQSTGVAPIIISLCLNDAFRLAQLVLEEVEPVMRERR